MMNGKRVFRRELCTGCGACASVCYAEALVLIGKEMSAQEVVDEVEQDKDYYRNSGGGVTVSGGEPLFQCEFTYEILRLSKERGIHTAIESNLSLPWEKIKTLLPVTDLIMMDIKSMDESIHREWTGISNRLVLENVMKLSQLSVPLIVRTPVIPGVNDREEDIRAIAGFISSFPNLEYYELLPYHPLGTGKYDSLGMEYALKGVKRPDPEKMRALATSAREAGIEVRTSGDKR